MIVLLELHCYAQTKDDLKDKISFHPCGKSDSDQFDSERLLHIIGYSHCLGVSAFNDNLRLFLSGADLSGVNLSGVNLIEAKLRDANLSGVNLIEAKLRDANLRGADLRDANLRGADLIEANLIEAKLRDANLRGADLIEAKLRDANLRNATLLGAALGGADLSDANFRGAALGDADLGGADLSDANLTKANLNNANLSGANLSSANLRDANLEAVVWDRDTKWLNSRNLHKVVGVSPELGQDSAFAAAVSLSQGISWVKEGKIKEAQEAFKQAQIFDESLRDSAEFWNSICWIGCLHSYAKGVLPICEKAVTLDPDYKGYQDSRGLARVLTGDLVGALEDFQAAVDSGALDFSEDVKRRRLRWIEALKSGNNPLTPEELEELRGFEG